MRAASYAEARTGSFAVRRFLAAFLEACRSFLQNVGLRRAEQRRRRELRQRVVVPMVEWKRASWR